MIKKQVIVGKNLFINCGNNYNLTDEEHKESSQLLKALEGLFNKAYDAIYKFAADNNLTFFNTHIFKAKHFLEYLPKYSTIDGQYYDFTNHIVIYRYCDLKGTKYNPFEHLDNLYSTIIHELLHMSFTNVLETGLSKNNKTIPIKTIVGTNCIRDFTKDKRSGKNKRKRYELDEMLVDYLSYIIAGREYKPRKDNYRTIINQLNLPIIWKALKEHKPNLIFNKIDNFEAICKSFNS